VNRRRNRMVSFRVSEQDFELLKVRANAEGARSISDYARLALCRSDRPSTIQADLAAIQLSEDIHQLREQLLQMTELLATAQRTEPTASPYTRHTARTADVQENEEPRALQLATRKTGRA
jgi:hypothetical protein